MAAVMRLLLVTVMVVILWFIGLLIVNYAAYLTYNPPPIPIPVIEKGCLP